MRSAGVSGTSAPKAITMSSGSASSSSSRAVTASAGSARLPTITGCTNSTATWRASEMSPVASRRPPRAKRSAISPHSRASRSASAANHEALASRRRSTASASITQAPSPGAASRGHASMPSPVRALTCIRATPGWTASRLRRKRSMSKSRCGSRSILLMTTSSQVRNMSGYLSGLSSPSVTEETITRASSPTRNSAGQTRLPTFSITSRSRSCSGISGSALRTMLASRWHSPPNPGSVLSCVTGTCRLASRSAS